MNSQKTASVSVLIVMSALGWVLTCIFGVLVCFLAADSRSRDVPWQVLGAMVLGPILSSIPIGVLAFLAYRAFSADSPRQPAKSPLGEATSWLSRIAPWRGLTILVLIATEVLLFPLTFALAASDDDTLILTIPLNLLIGLAIVFAACLPHRRRIAIVFCCIHLVGIVIATLVAAVEIGSVIVTGFLLLFSAIALASLGERPHALRVLFGLSTVVFILASFFVIAIGGFSEREADAPLFAAIVAYQIIFVPIGLLVLHRTWTKTGPAARLQFDLKQLLTLMGAVCFAAAVARVSMMIDDDFQVAIALGLGALILSGIAAVFFMGRKGKAIGAPAPLQKSQPAQPA